VYATTCGFPSAKQVRGGYTRRYKVCQTNQHGLCGGFSNPLPNWTLRIPRIGTNKRCNGTSPSQCIPNQVGEGGSIGIDTYCVESCCINSRLHVLHMKALATTDAHQRETITDEIDSYVVPCSILRRAKTNGSSSGTRCLPSIGFTCMCKDKNESHTVYINTNASAKRTTLLPIQCIFLLQQDQLTYGNLPDLGIFIRSTMTKKFFSPNAMSQHAKIHDTFTGVGKKNTRKKSNHARTRVLDHKHWSETMSNSWCTSMLLETIPCLNRYKRGFKHVYEIDSVDANEVRACIQIMYGCLLRLYPRGSKTPTFNARVNLVVRIQTLLEQSQKEQMQFVEKFPALIKLCLMEYCYNVLLDFFPVEYALVCTHPSMPLYDTAARVMFDTFRRDVISTGLEEWDIMDAKAASSIERCMRMCKFKMNKNISTNTTQRMDICDFTDPFWNLPHAHGDISVLTRYSLHKLA
jgi:hypothetical protein